MITQPCGSVTSCGISPGFPGLSLTLGQVGHVLLTRSPLGSSSASTGALVRLACIKHAASVRPEPGSNSPLRNSLMNSSEMNATSTTALCTDRAFGIYVVLTCRPQRSDTARRSACRSGPLKYTRNLGFQAAGCSLERCASRHPAAEGNFSSSKTQRAAVRQPFAARPKS